VLCAPDKLRDAASAVEAAAALTAGATRAGWSAREFPIADGGEGTLDVLIGELGGAIHETAAEDALGRARPGRFGLLPDGTGIVVAADVIGLQELSDDERDVMRTSSRGLAAPLRAAVAAGARRLVVFLGGTANMDGGLGLLVGLGAHARDGIGRDLTGTGADLLRLDSLDLAPALAALRGVELVLASDVQSPLLGPDGAAHLFGPQKGADPEQIVGLDAAMARLAELIGTDPATPGAGAAGGLGYVLSTLGAERVGGADLVLELTGFTRALAGADLCLTGEGKVDRSSLAGKAVGAVLAACERAGVPCVVLGGALTPDADDLYAHGAAAVLSISRGAHSLPQALDGAAADLEAAAHAVCRLVATARDY
jgi:glycerate kinase